MHQSTKPKQWLQTAAVLSIAVVGVVSGVVLAPATASQVQSLSKSQPQEAPPAYPVVDLEHRAPVSKASLARARIFNNAFGQSIVAFPREVEPLPLGSHWWAYLPALPVQESDVIAIGQVMDAQAFLSEDEAGIFSQFSVQIERVLKTDNSVLVSSSAELVRVGGAVRYQSGRKLTFTVEKQKPLQVGRRYLFFLRNLDGASDVLTAYELRPGGTVAPLDDDPLLPFVKYRGVSDIVLMRALQSALDESLTPGHQEKAKGAAPFIR